VLTPLAIDPGHPFPSVRNKSVNLIAVLTGSHRQDATPAFAVVQVPGVLSRLVPVKIDEPGTRACYVLLDALIAEHIGDLFPGFRCLGAWPFRVIRNFDLTVDEEDAEDLLESIAEEVRRRDRGNAVRLTVDAEASAPAVEMLTKALKIDPAFVFRAHGPLSIADLVGMAAPLRDEPGLRDEPLVPQIPPPFRDIDPEEIFDVIAKGDVLLHHPFESFDPVVTFIEQAAHDPDVLAIKQTLYRTSGDSPVVKALLRAAEFGKQVTALVEIKARFDEENNIQFARKLEEAGVTVVYGLVGLKTHAKMALVVRREHGELRRYVHLGTGNYNPSTARSYTDISFFTAKPAFGEDATSLFNLLTSCTAPPTWRSITVAPLGLHERVLGLIEREAANARAGLPSRIIAKMNSLVDPDVVASLYRASQAGVPIDLIVRGICVLRPGVPGVSETIRVSGVVDRFLEHSRLFYFEAGGAKELYAASADWMPRNFHRRVEVMFPIEDEPLKARLWEILTISRDDNVKARRLRSDGIYERVRPAEGEPERRSQKRFIDLARDIAERADARARRDRPFIVRPVRTRPTKEPEKTPTETQRESVPPAIGRSPTPTTSTPPTTTPAGPGTPSGTTQ
jgi:polyphosphate kinase